MTGVAMLNFSLDVFRVVKLRVWQSNMRDRGIGRNMKP